MRHRALSSVLVAAVVVAVPSQARGDTSRLSNRAAVAAASKHAEPLLEAKKVRAPRKVLSERAALTRSGDGQALADSLTPQYVKRDGRWIGIDSTLRRLQDGWAPKATDTGLRVPASAAGDATLKRIGVSVSLGGVRDTAGHAEKAGVVYPNVLPDTDAVLASRPQGLQIGWVLRSPASPRSLALDLDPGVDRYLRRDGDGFQIRSGGRSVAHVLPPVAWDADQRPVDVDYVRTGAGLQVVVSPKAGARYPIVVDPVIESPSSDSYPFMTWRQGWVYYYSSSGTPVLYENSSCSGVFDWNVSSDGTIDIQRACDQYDTHYGELVFGSPGQSSISRIDTGGFYFAYGGGCGFLGIRDPSGTDEGMFSYQTGYRSTTAINSPCHTGTPVQNVCVTYSCNPGGTPGNSAYFGIDWSSGTGGSSVSTGIGVLNDVTLYREDTDLPTITVAPQTGPYPWFSGYGGNVQVQVDDAGLGVRSAALKLANGTYIGVMDTGCSGAMTHQCAASWNGLNRNWVLNGDAMWLPDGISTVYAEATDAVGNQTASPLPSAKLAVDRTGPAITFPNGGVLTGTPMNGTAQRTVQINAADGVSGGTDAQRRSGVVAMTVEVSKLGNSGFEQEASYTQTCATDSCAMSRQFVVDATKYGPGQHTVRVTATDKIGNTSTNEIQFVIDNVGPAINLSGSLWDAGSPTGVPSTTLTRDEYRLQADVIDGVLPVRGAGVKDIELYVTEQINGSPVERQLDATTRTCKDVSCDRTLVATVDTTKLVPGPLTFRVRATDSLGNVSNKTFYAAVGTINFDQTRWSGLEDFLQYDEVDTGGGSSAYVNFASGNLVWQHTPIVNPGRGLSTFAQVTYNAQSASSYNELSTGWSLSISGLTRVNEPLDLSTANFGSVRLIDGDGTQHPFTLSADGTHFLPPPGVQLHLRRYDQGQKAWAITRPDGITFYYDHHGYQTWVEDRNGNKLRFTYAIVPRQTGVTCPTWPLSSSTALPATCRQRLISVTDAAGLPPTNAPNRAVTLNYGSNTGPITSIADHAGRITLFSYNATTQRLATLTEAYGAGDAERAFSFSYEPTGSDRDLGAVTDPRGHQTQFTYTGGYGSLTASGLVQDPLADKRVTTLRDRRTNTHTYTYSTATAGSDSWWTATMTDARSKTYSYRMDRRGRPVRRVDPLSTTMLMSYDADNNLVKLTEASGTSDEAITRMSYNRNGRLIEEIDALGNRTVLRYRDGTGYSPGATLADSRPDYVSDLIRIEKPKGADTGDPNDYATRFILDDRGKVTKTIDASGGEWETYYQDFGLVDYEIDAADNPPTSYHDYDPSGFPREIHDAKNGRWYYAYDAVGNVTAFADPRSTQWGGLTDPLKRYRTTLTYDELDRLRTEQVSKYSTATTADHIDREYFYDDNGNLVQVNDGQGADSHNEFDEMDNVTVQETPAVLHEGDSHPTTERTTHSYDAEQNVLTTTRPKGQTHPTPGAYSTAYAYDGINRPVVERRRSRTSSASVDLITSYAYDRRDNLVGMSDPRANANWPTDPEINAKTTARQRWAYTYDKADRQTIKVEDPAGLQLTTRTDYDEHGNITRVRDPRNKTSDFGPADPLTPNATYETLYSYDAADRPLTQERDGSKTELVRRGDGRVVEVRNPRYFTAERQGPNDFVTKYKYDFVNDVVEVTQPRIASSTSAYANKERKLVFQRDAVGNAITVTDPRGRSFANTYLDTGDLLTTTRPSMWRFSPGAGGDEVSLKNLEEMGNAAEEPDGAAQGEGDFGGVSSQRMPGVLPEAGDIQLSYDDELRLTTVTELESPVVGGGRAERTLGRDWLGRVTQLTLPYKRDSGTTMPIVHEFKYDAHGNQVSSSDGENNVTTTAFDQFDRVSSTTTPPSSTASGAAGNTTEVGYDENSNVTSVREPNGAAYTTYSCFDKADRVVARIDQELAVTRLRLDNLGQVVRQRSPRGTAKAASSPSCSTYPMLDGGPRGSWDTDSVYDPNGWMTQSTDRLGQISSYVYDRAGNQTSASEPGAKASSGGTVTPRVTTRTFDGRNLPWASSRGTAGTPNAKTTTVTEYDGNQNLRRTVKETGLVSGLPRYPDSPQETSDYASTSDQANAAIRNATWRAELHEYSDDNQLTATHRPWGSLNPADTDPEVQKRYRQDFVRDARGYLTAVRRLNHWTTNPPVCTATAASPPGTSCVKQTQYTNYDNGWIKTATGPDGFAGTTAVYGEVQSYDYDRRGLQTSWNTKTDRPATGTNPSRTSNRAYFPSGKLRLRTIGAHTTVNRQWTYDYDANGRQTSMTDNGYGTYAMGYDRVGRQTSHDDQGANNKDTLTAYDLAGNRTSQRTDGSITNVSTGAYNGGKLTESTWDNLDRESSTAVTPASGAVQRWNRTFHPSGQPESTVELEGSTTRLVQSEYFRNDGQPISLNRVNASNASVMENGPQSYTYDGDGNRTEDENGRYEYNARSQLTKWSRKAYKADGTQELFDDVTDYKVDGDGELISKQTTSGGPNTQTGTTTYNYAGDRLQSTTVSGPFEQPTTYGYTAASGANPAWIQEGTAGQSTAKRTSYTYDAYNRVTQSQPQTYNGSTWGSSGSPTNNTYDGFDRRSQSTTGTDTTKYAYVGATEQLSQQTKGTSTSSFDFSGEGEPLGMSGPNGYRSFGLTVNGSIGTLENGSGSSANVGGLLNRYRYDPYGAARSSLGVSPTPAGSDIENQLTDDAKANPLRFQGFIYDSALKTYDMQARAYRPEVGRFQTADRLEDSAQDLSLETDPLTQNRYAWAGGNPITNIEYDGHGIFDDIKDEVEEKAEDTAKGVKDFGEGVGDAAKESYELAKNPKLAAKGVANAVKDPIGTAKAVAKSCDGRSVANCAGYAVGSAVGAKGGAAVVKAGVKGGLKAGAKAGAKQSASGANVTSGTKRTPTASPRGSSSSSSRSSFASDGNSSSYSARRSDSSRNSSSSSRGTSCSANSFLPTTPVLMADGTTKGIGSIIVGDSVLATDPVTGVTGARRVEHLIVGQGVKSMVRVTVDGEVIHATDGHPFWVESRDAWIDAGDLQVGDVLLTEEGTKTEVEAVRAYRMVGRVFNLTVAGLHTYYAGAEPVLVHNANPCWQDEPEDRSAKYAGEDGDGELLDKAYKARDELARKVGSSKATVTAGYDPKSGRVAAGCNRNPVGCAEQDVRRKLGVRRDQVRFTKAVRPRTGEEVEICQKCQGRFKRTQFPRDTEYQKR